MDDMDNIPLTFVCMLWQDGHVLHKMVYLGKYDNVPDVIWDREPEPVNCPIH
jgi:hypothetical protein